MVYRSQTWTSQPWMSDASLISYRPGSVEASQSLTGIFVYVRVQGAPALRAVGKGSLAIDTHPGRGVHVACELALDLLSAGHDRAVLHISGETLLEASSS
jgi:hypothetical protein